MFAQCIAPKPGLKILHLSVKVAWFDSVMKMASSVHHQPQQIDFESVSFQADANNLVIAWSVLCDWDDCSVTAGMSNFSVMMACPVSVMVGVPCVSVMIGVPCVNTICFIYSFAGMCVCNAFGIIFFLAACESPLTNAGVEITM
ncbi:hypothetical protein OUZ56_033729 [Daphnia magna]|uniref:Uncharacterized protein n=1 Tax=Daphnia magna TaxID=35525 RepID=A0ABQ9ZY68_9CRUS|nr:hypothetical protein OUZ56_033729 [Daphnia magna]